MTTWHVSGGGKKKRLWTSPKSAPLTSISKPSLIRLNESMSDPPDLPSTGRLTNADVDQDLPQTLAAPPRPYNRIGDTL